MIKKICIYNINNKINIFLAFFLVFNICLIESNLARAENRQETYKQLNLFGDVFVAFTQLTGRTSLAIRIERPLCSFD